MKNFLKSFIYAFRGILAGFKNQRNIWVQLTLGVCAIGCAFLLKLPVEQLCILFIVCFLVIASELFNTAIEKTVDMISPEIHPDAGKIKDISAGAVLVLAILSVFIGGLLFIPPILRLFGVLK